MKKSKIINILKNINLKYEEKENKIILFSSKDENIIYKINFDKYQNIQTIKDYYIVNTKYNTFENELGEYKFNKKTHLNYHKYFEKFINSKYLKFNV